MYCVIFYSHKKYDLCRKRWVSIRSNYDIGNVLKKDPRKNSLDPFCQLVALAICRVTIAVAIVIACYTLTLLIANHTNEKFRHSKLSFLNYL